jgi:hypothetical protein
MPSPAGPRSGLPGQSKAANNTAAPFTPRSPDRPYWTALGGRGTCCDHQLMPSAATATSGPMWGPHPGPSGRPAAAGGGRGGGALLRLRLPPLAPVPLAPLLSVACCAPPSACSLPLPLPFLDFFAASFARFNFIGRSAKPGNQPVTGWIKSVNADSPINKVKSDKIRKCRLSLFFSF